MGNLEQRGVYHNSAEYNYKNIKNSWKSEKPIARKEDFCILNFGDT